MTKILVIEDNPHILEEILLWLELEGYEAVGAPDGRIGVKVALEQLPDLILSDIMMPEKDGYRVLLELRAHPATALTPFIFLTAKQEKIDMRYGMHLGADDYLTKPIERDELFATLRTQLARRKLFEQHTSRQMNDWRDNLLSTLPHELRTPLTGILGIGELLSHDAASLTLSEISEYGELILTSGQRLYRLIENCLLYTQLERHVADPQYGNGVGPVAGLEAAPVISQTSEAVARLYERQTALHLDLQPGLVRMMNKHLSKVVEELVDNAFKFSAAPTPVQVTGQVQAGQYVFTVADQGRGLSPENIARIAAYVQFERAIYEQQGLGLGLTIARLLTTLYGGQFQIESTPGGGTMVRVSLPTV